MTLRHAPFFLTGAPKSGTTWLGKLLDAHPEITCRGEACVHHFGLRMVEASKSYNDLLAKRREVITDSNDFPPMKWADVMALMRHFIELRLEAIADPAKPGLRFLGEKDPEHGMHLKVLNDLFPEGKVIHIIRDGRAVFVSAWHHNVRSQDPNLKRLGFDDFLDITAMEWADRVQRAREAGKLLGDRYFELRYEDLAAEPEHWAGRVFDFLGARADAATVKACVESASFEKLSRGRKPGHEDKASFFRKGVPDDWKNELSPAQVQRFGGLAGPVLMALGYTA
ncbi:MAG TPA: sulfotransferase [Holophagaceae bacterium]|nr:sulfotransferase [Holophagaceae bacterium]